MKAIFRNKFAIKRETDKLLSMQKRENFYSVKYENIGAVRMKAISYGVKIKR